LVSKVGKLATLPFDGPARLAKKHGGTGEHRKAKEQ
jgi:hypothetical protein